MAECKFARCVLERRAVRKQLQSWTKTMVCIVGLERVAEELMGRRRWRHYQLVLSPDHPPMEPDDWQPADKCNLCLDSPSAASADASAAALPAPPRAPSEGSASSDSAGAAADVGTMTTLESVASSMAASLAAVAALSHGAKPPYPPPALFPWYLGPEPPEPGPPATAPEQPLDLSKSSSSNSGRSPEPQSDAHDGLAAPPVHMPAALNRLYKAKPRLSAVAGRRTYTEDELQAALRDIQSGKLGTRRAAVIYGIPRSTLRNKVYKLAMERDRDSHLVTVSPDNARAMDDDQEDDEKDSGAEEEREVEKALLRPILSVEDFMRLSAEGGFPGPDSLRTLLQHGGKLQEGKEDGSSPPLGYPGYPPPGIPDMWNGFDHSALGPYITRLLGNPMVNPFAVPSRASPTERSPTDSPGDFASKNSNLDFLRRMMIEDRLLQEERHKKERQFLNGSRLGEPGPSSCSSGPHEEENSGSATPPNPNVILRIPSFKPAPKNGMPGELGFPLGVKVGESSQHSMSSPPITVRSESSSPPSMAKGISVSLRDVIAKSISQKFQQPGELHHLPHTPPGLEHFRRDFSQPLGQHIMRNHNNNHLMDDRKMHVTTSKPQQTNSTNTGGKGTRPKRGKYRNYDRDSLVEAVRAVQRGEMSVHRAGSYYGVPHSTLEYKVKERHLMRPRKREPKSVQDEIKLKEDPMSRIPQPMDKSKLLPPTKPLKPPFTPPTNLPPGVNGLKMPPMFDPSLPYSAAHPFPFWPPNPFPHLPMDYPRTPNFPPTPDHFFASQMIQRLQEDSSRTPHQSPPLPLGKTARELAETLYDGSGTNGSFLDGIIRSSLESGLQLKNREGEIRRPENMSNKALLDQLCRNSRMTPLPKAELSSSDDDESRRAQKRPVEESSKVDAISVKEEPLEDLPSHPEVKTEPREEVNVEDSILKPDNVDESACDSTPSIKRVKLEEET